MNYYIEVLRKWNDFKGRSRRTEYWYFALFNFLVAVILSFISIIGNSKVFIYILYAYCIILIIPTLAVMVRRLHDTDRNGWWFFISLIPIIGPIWLFVLVVLDSNSGDNKYGPNPKISAPLVQPTME
jgi:uncharacterized membrane protein YhaH (DUF805 family)